MSVFKRLPSSHLHVRTPIMIGLIVLLVILGSAVCYYRVGTSSEASPQSAQKAVPAPLR